MIAYNLIGVPMQDADKFMTGLQNTLLVASPALNDTPWENTVIYICSHSEEGTMGVVINRPLEDITFTEITSELEIPRSSSAGDPVIFSGGPVEINRGFVLHNDGYQHESTMRIAPNINLSATSDIVTAIARGTAPEDLNFCLGYSGWDSGQLEQELVENSWFTLSADTDILYKTPPEQRHDACMKKLGLDPSRISVPHGSA